MPRSTTRLIVARRDADIPTPAGALAGRPSSHPRRGGSAWASVIAANSRLSNTVSLENQPKGRRLLPGTPGRSRARAEIHVELGPRWVLLGSATERCTATALGCSTRMEHPKPHYVMR